MKPIFILITLFLFLSCKEKQSGTIVVKGHSLGKVSVIDSSYVATKTKYFKIQDRTIIGGGRTMLDTLISTSQFIMFGELHGSKNTSQLITALVPLLHKAGFNHTAFEVGPYSAKKLVSLSTPPSATVDNLKKFTSRYAGKEDNQVPIPFFDGLEDAYFLQSIRTHDMNLWGLDQEYYSATLYFMDELLSFVKKDANYAIIKSEKEKASKIIASWYTKEENSDTDIDIFNEFQKEPAVQQYLNRFRDDETTKTIVNDLEISWDIYSRWRSDSHADRISYMRNNFMKYYQEALKTEVKPKVFLKFGSLHASKILTNGCYDLGNLVTELATKNGTKATIINSWNRYYSNEKGEEIDYLKKYSRYYKRVRDFIVMAKTNEWAIIDLKSIRNDIKNGRIALPTNGNYHRVKQLLDGYDYQLILPLDKAVTPNKKQ